MTKIKKYLYLGLFLIGSLFGQAFNGMTLFTPTGSGTAGNNTTYLINNNLEGINSWIHPRGAASIPYLLEDSTLIYPYRVQNPSMSAGGVGGGISKYNWEGDILWSYEFANETYQHHHDIEPLPNGNILVII